MSLAGGPSQRHATAVFVSLPVYMSVCPSVFLLPPVCNSTLWDRHGRRRSIRSVRKHDEGQFPRCLSSVTRLLCETHVYIESMLAFCRRWVGSAFCYPHSIDNRRFVHINLHGIRDKGLRDKAITALYISQDLIYVCFLYLSVF